MKGMITAVELAKAKGIDIRVFRRALRAANLKWHTHNERWEVPIDSQKHQDMQRVLSTVPAGTTLCADIHEKGEAPTQSIVKMVSDETWIIDLCDKVLGKQAVRQHRFPFLLGDVGRSGRSVPLPVDAYYPDLNLVIEYHERQHTSSVPHFDKRNTVSGVSRDKQRTLYDERRRIVLPQHGLQLVVLDYSEFNCTGAGKLVRDNVAEMVVAERLKGF